MPGRLVGGIVPTLAPRLAGESRQQRPGLPVVAALEDSRRLDADEQAVAGSCERRHLRDLAPVLVAVGEALARHLPRLAEVGAAPDGGAVPLARGGGVDLAGSGVVHLRIYRDRGECRGRNEYPAIRKSVSCFRGIQQFAGLAPGARSLCGLRGGSNTENDYE